MKVMNRLKKRIPVFLCVFCMFGGESSLWAQKHLVLDLNRTILLLTTVRWNHSVRRICIYPVIGSIGLFGQIVCLV